MEYILLAFIVVMVIWFSVRIYNYHKDDSKPKSGGGSLSGGGDGEGQLPQDQVQ